MAAPKGNNNAGKGKQWREALERALARSVKGKVKSIENGLDPIANIVVRNALNGDREAWQEIANRLDGRPVTPIAGDEDVPLFPTDINVHVVKPGKRRKDPTED
jgi:hypothetical protein